MWALSLGFSLKQVFERAVMTRKEPHVSESLSKPWVLFQYSSLPTISVDLWVVRGVTLGLLLTRGILWWSL